MGDGDGIDVIPSEVSIFKRFVDDGEDCLKMGTGSDFRNDAAIGGEDVDLRNNDI